MTLHTIGADELFELVSPAQAVQALRDALREGFDPAEDSERSSVPLHKGEMLLMPSSLPQASGVKVLTVAPDEPGRELPRIQGQYLLFDGPTSAPIAIIDGAAMTNLRTPALSLAGIYGPLIARAEKKNEGLKVAIFGTGPQGQYHEHTVRDVLKDYAEPTFTFISRTQPEGWTIGRRLAPMMPRQRLPMPTSSCAPPPHRSRSLAQMTWPRTPSSWRWAPITQMHVSFPANWLPAHRSSSKTAVPPSVKPVTSSWQLKKAC
ncbi:Putative ornithine cyclodeaminase, mu-crystallin [Corynebacterium camporealensis]|nr:Putative ornithine cyclodeaminase, mu-crystallin [Corynebacterium camporealensis]